MTTISCILVPLDLGESAARTLDYARMVGGRFGASLVLMHVVPNPYITAASDVYLPPPQQFIERLEADAHARLHELVTESDRQQFRVRTIVRVGDPLSAIVEYAKTLPADLIIMGTHGRTGVAHFVLGSVAERVVRTASCPVLTVR